MRRAERRRIDAAKTGEGGEKNERTRRKNGRKHESALRNGKTVGKRKLRAGRRILPGRSEENVPIFYRREKRKKKRRAPNGNACVAASVKT